MSKQIKLRVVLNKGRKGVPLGKLPKVLAGLYAFLDSIAQDLGLKDDKGWQGIDFKNGSLDFIAVKNSVVQDADYVRVNQSLRNVVENTDDVRITRRTRSQYAKIATAIDPDEVIDIGLLDYQREISEGELNTELEDSFQWHALDKAMANKILDTTDAKIRAYASIQGKIHSVFIESERPHFDLRELSTKDLVHCYYADGKYDDLAKILSKKGAIVFVHGFSSTDMMASKVYDFEVDEIKEAPRANSETLHGFIGCAPGWPLGTSADRGE